MGKRKTVLIEFEEAFNSYTGIPLSTVNDALCIVKSGCEVILWYRSDKKTEKINQWISSNFSEKEAERIHLNRTRPSNYIMWLTQYFTFFQGENICCDYAYSRLFPRLPLRGLKNYLLRLDDPYGKSSNFLKNFALDVFSGVDIKLAFARSLRTKGYQKIRKNALCVFNSEYTRGLWCEIYDHPDSGDCVIYPPVQFSFEDVDPETTEFYSVKTVPNYFIHIGGQRQRKDPVAVIEVWAKNLQDYSFDFLVVGKIDSVFITPEIETAINLKRLRFINNIESNELRRLLLASTGILFNSRGEGFGNPIAEGVFLGVPVVCNDLEVFQEIGEGWAFFYPSGEYESALGIMQNLVYGNLKPPQKMEEKFSFESAIQQWRNFLDNKEGD